MSSNVSFIQSLIWSLVSEFETKFDRKVKLISKIFELVISEKYNISDNAFQVSKISEELNPLYEKYKLCYLNCLSVDYYLQNGKYETEFTEKSKLGEGGFGVVYEVRSKLDQQNYAMKKVRVIGKFDHDLNKSLNEIKIWESLKNQYIVEYKTGWIEDVEYLYPHRYREDDTVAQPGFSASFQLTTNNTLFIQMELCEKTLEELTFELNSELNQTETKGINGIGFHVAFNIFLEIMNGINYLHTQKPPLIHRDIKPSNILIKKHSNGCKFVKISDFGLITPHNRSTMTHTSGQGTPEFIAPEVKNGREYDEKSDIYSVGVLISKMFLLSPNRAIGILNLIKTANFGFKNYYLQGVTDSDFFKEYVHEVFCRSMKLISENPNERPNSNEILNLSNNYCIASENVKRSKNMQDIYFKWLKNECVGSDLLNDFLLKQLGINDPNFSDFGLENMAPFETIFTSKQYEKINSKLLEDKISDFDDLEYWFTTEYGLKCILIQLENKTCKKLFDAFAKHGIEYSVLYSTNCDIVLILMNKANHHMIQFICKKEGSYFEIQTNEDIEFVSSSLNKCDHLDNINLVSDTIAKYEKISGLVEHSKLIYVTKSFIYIMTNEKKFFIYEIQKNNLIEIKSLENKEIIDVLEVNKSDKLNAIVLTDDGSIYSWETNTYKTALEKDYYTPVLINKNYEFFKFVKVCYGDGHALALTNSGEVYVWGDKYYGREDCGCIHHSLDRALLSQKKDKCDYHNGKEYRSVDTDDLIPVKIGAFNNNSIHDISSGYDHSMAIDINGNLYAWGNNVYGQLVVNDQNKRSVPTLLDRKSFMISNHFKCENKITVTKILCNRNDSFVLAHNGDVYACGLSTCESDCFIKINDPSNRFVDICAQNQMQLLVAKSTDGYCFVFGAGFTNDYYVLLMKTPLKSMHNCLFMANYYLAKTYKPLSIHRYYNENKEYSEYQLIKLLEKNAVIINYYSDTSLKCIDFDDVIVKALRTSVSFHAIKIYLENTPELDLSDHLPNRFRCYVMESSEKFLDALYGVMNENNLKYLLVHENSFKIIVILLEKVYSSIIDNFLKENTNY